MTANDHPQANSFYAETYDASVSTRTATAQTIWEEYDANGHPTIRDSGPHRYRVVTRQEMKDLFEQTGLVVDNLYGDFEGGQLTEESSEMIWLAKPATTPPAEISLSLQSTGR